MTPSKRYVPRAQERTRHVLRAVSAYHRRGRTLHPETAPQAAIECFHKMSGQIVSKRTVRRWVVIVESYGGFRKVPANAFWGKKSHPVPQPVCDRLADIHETAGKLFFLKGHSRLSFARRLVPIDQAMSHIVALVKGGSPRYLLRSIRQSSRFLIRNRRPNQPHHFISEDQLYAALSAVLGELRRMAGRRKKRPFKSDV